MIEQVTRMPFDNPKDPLAKKLDTHIKAQGKQPFWDYFLPLAVIKIKHAIGRTQRRPQQKAAVVNPDSRILHRSYGPLVNKALEEDYNISSQNFAKSITEISEFLL